MAHVGGFEVDIRPPDGPRQWIAELARRQQGVVAHWQLIEGGLSPSAVQRLIRAGWLQPLYVGVYAVGHRAMSWLGRCRAGVFAGGRDALLSHQPAGGLWEVHRSSSSAIHITVPRSRPGAAGLRVHRVRSLHPEDVTEIDGIPVTSLARTFLDNAEVLPVRQVIRMIEEAERRQVFDLGALERLLARSHGRHGVKPLRAALAQLNGEPARVNSDWERDFLDFCDDHGIQRPEVNAMVERFEVDAFWRHAGLVVELDSWTHHRGRSAFENDREKIAALQLAGYVVLPITWRRLAREPEVVAEMIRPRV
jgi:Transcriptional regulator, AbiEi antitoxin